MFFQRKVSMGLQFVLGNSGSGKTEYIYRNLVAEAVANPGLNYLVVVPEQFTMQTQRCLVDLSPNKVIMNIDVLSFKRLAYRVFDELGIRGLDILEDTGKNLVLRRVAQEKREELVVFRASVERMGFVNELKSLISEFSQYNISPEELRHYLNENTLAPTLEAKLKDILVIYEGFREFLEETYITEEEILTVLMRVATESSILKNSTIVFDEFTGFTPIQNCLLEKLLPICQTVYVSLTIDEKESFFQQGKIQDLFDMPKKTIHTLVEIAQKQYIEIKDPIVLSDNAKKRFKNAPELAFMEKNLFRNTYQRKLGEVEAISLLQTTNPKAEILLVAREINRLVREEGYRYKEIAVVSGAVETYGPYVEEEFSKFHIPYFLDTTKEVLFHPFIEFIRSIFEVIQKDFSYESVFRMLRCGYFDITYDEIDRLENYILATGIRGRKAWSGKWTKSPKRLKEIDFEQLEKMRNKIYNSLEPLLLVFQDSNATVEMQIMAFYQLIEERKIEAQLQEREESLLQEGKQTKAKEYGQIYQVVMDLLDKSVLLFGKMHMKIHELIDLLDAGFSAARVAVIPPGYDSVTIGDIERTRLTQIKVLFFVGVNDGIIPQKTTQTGIISQFEREFLQENNLQIAPGIKELSFRQRYYLYLNLTKPSDKLYISYSKVSENGEERRPSYLIRTLLRIFPDMVTKRIDNPQIIADDTTLESARDYLIYGERDDKWYAIANWFYQDGTPKNQEELKKILKACYEEHVDCPISKKLAEQLFGKELNCSVTRLEQYAQCSYAHFLKYGLRLEERELSSFDAIDIGNLFHEGLRKYGVKVKQSEYDWFLIPEEKRMEYANKALEEAITGSHNSYMLETAENLHVLECIRKEFLQMVQVLSTQVQKGEFYPTEYELPFGAGNQIDSLSMMLSHDESINLHGIIDRIDIRETPEEVQVKIIDYKTGNKDFDFKSLYHGYLMQLPLYLYVAIELQKKKNPNKRVVPAGIFYQEIADPIILYNEDATITEYKENLLSMLRPNGLVNRDEEVYRGMDDGFESKSDVIPVKLKKDGTIMESSSSVVSEEQFWTIMNYVNTYIRQVAENIYAGNIDANPYKCSGKDSCKYCKYGHICGIASKIPGYKTRKLLPMEKEEILQMMESENAKNKQ